MKHIQTCTSVQTHFEGTNYPYWCSTHDDGMTRPDVACMAVAVQPI